MTMKWTREAFLVTLTLVVVLFGFYYFGNQYFVDPVKQEADLLSQLVSDQETVLAAYPPNEDVLDEYELNYTQTESFLPIGDEANEAMVTFEQLANQEDVTISSVSRISDRQSVEGLSTSFVKNSYQAELSSESPEDFRNLIDQLMDEERVWNITSFAYDKSGDASYTGTITFDLYYYMEVAN